MTDFATIGMKSDTTGLLDAQRELGNLTRKGADTEREVDGQAQRKGRSWKAMAAKAGAALVAIGTGVTLAVRGQLNSIDELAKQSERIGIPVEHLSQLQHAADLSGVGMQTLEGAMRRLSRAMVDSPEDFAALGINVRDAGGEMRDTASVMEDVADVLAAMPDGAEKTALAFDLMSRYGTQMIPMLNQGGDALRSMREEADRLGLTISQDTAQAAQAFNDNLTRLTGQTRGFWRMIAAELAPTLERLSGILVTAAERFQGLSPEMRSLISNGALAAAAVAAIVAPLGLLIGAFVLVGAKIALAVAAVVAITAAVVAFWPQIVAAKDAVVEFVSDGIDRARDAIAAIGPAVRDFTDRMIDLGNRGVEFVKDKLRELVAFLADLPRQFREAGANLMSGLAEGITSRFSTARDAIGGAARGLVDRFRRDTEQQSPSRLFRRLGGFLMDGLALGIRDNADKPIAEMGKVSSELKAVADQSQQWAQSMSGHFDGLITGGKGLQGVLQSIARQLESSGWQMLFQGLGSGGFLSGLFGGVGAPLNAMGSGPLAGFRADGGPVSAGRTYMVGERGPELFTPRSSGQITSNEAMRGGGMGGHLHVTVSVDDEGALRAFVDRRMSRERPGIISDAVGATYRAAEEVPIGVR